jgi:hypothetical protein
MAGTILVTDSEEASKDAAADDERRIDGLARASMEVVDVRRDATLFAATGGGVERAGERGLWVHSADANATSRLNRCELNRCNILQPCKDRRADQRHRSLQPHDGYVRHEREITGSRCVRGGGRGPAHGRRAGRAGDEVRSARWTGDRRPRRRGNG